MPQPQQHIVRLFTWLRSRSHSPLLIEFLWSTAWSWCGCWAISNARGAAMAAWKWVAGLLGRKIRRVVHADCELQCSLMMATHSRWNQLVLWVLNHRGTTWLKVAEWPHLRNGTNMEQKAWNGPFFIHASNAPAIKCTRPLVHVLGPRNCVTDVLLPLLRSDLPTTYQNRHFHSTETLETISMRQIQTVTANWFSNGSLPHWS